MFEQLKSKNYLDLLVFSNEVKDLHQDFYITMNNERKYLNDIKVIQHYFENKLKHGEICLSDRKTCFLITWGFSDKNQRKFIKILSIDTNSARKALTCLLYQFGDKEWWVKVKKNNPLLKVYQGMGFNFEGGRGEEVLLVRKADKFRKKFIGDKEDA
jgi:hypothetical protein